jgi:hypothetical protein
MAMMGSAGWNGQDPGIHPPPDDEFQQFLDMNGMGNLGEGLQFDFEFQNAGGVHMAGSQPREPMDTPMSGTDTPGIPSRQDNVMHSRMQPVSTAASQPAIPTTMVPPTNEAMAEIDAQIHFLQQQKLQHQQRQMEEQQIAFFARQNRMVPPTPQSLELQAGTQFYPAPDQQQQALYERYQRLKEQQDV